MKRPVDVCGGWGAGPGRGQLGDSTPAPPPAEKQRPQGRVSRVEETDQVRRASARKEERASLSLTFAPCSVFQRGTERMELQLILRDVREHTALLLRPSACGEPLRAAWFTLCHLSGYLLSGSRGVGVMRGGSVPSVTIIPAGVKVPIHPYSLHMSCDIEMGASTGDHRTLGLRTLWEMPPWASALTTPKWTSAAVHRKDKLCSSGVYGVGRPQEETAPYGGADGAPLGIPSRRPECSLHG